MIRYDAGTLRAPEMQSNGWLRVDGYLTRTGIFDYRNADGSPRREYRPASEVFKADSMRTFSMVPVTNDHPPVLLNADNAKQYSVGSVGESVRKDGEHVAGSMMITDAATIADVQSGKAELSCGYECDTDETPGTFNGEHYDAIQKNIRGNHVAIVSRGRAQSAKLRLDQGDAVMVPRGDNTMKMMIKGVEVDVSDTAAQLFTAERKDAADALAAKAKEADVASARADAAEDKAGKAEKARNDAADPARFDTRVNERVGLMLQARAVLGGVVKLDGKTDREVKVAVLAKLAPEVKLDGRSDDYVTARFDIAAEEEDKKNPALFKARKTAAGESDDDAEEEGGKKIKKDAADGEGVARARMLKESQNAYKRPGA